MNCNEIQDLLHPLVDGEMPAKDKNVVTDHLIDCLDCQRAYALINETRTKLSQLHRYRAPDSLKKSIIAQIESENLTLQQKPVSYFKVSRLKPVMTHSIAALCGGFGIFILTQLSAPPALEAQQLQQQILNAHVRSLMDESVMQIASGDSHTVLPWFSGKLNFAPSVKDLNPKGFILIGGRVDYINDMKVAAIVYLRRKHKINLFIVANTQDFNSTTELAKSNWSRHGYNLVAWHDADFRYWAVSDISVNELTDFSNLLANTIDE